VEECTYFWGVNTSWGINTAESKRPLNQEDNQAPQTLKKNMKKPKKDMKKSKKKLKRQKLTIEKN
jgi:hypothetical protein